MVGWWRNDRVSDLRLRLGGLGCYQVVTTSTWMGDCLGISPTPLEVSLAFHPSGAHESITDPFSCG